MKRCRDFEEDLVAIAHGGDAPEARDHVSECPRCAKRLDQHRVMAHALSEPTWTPTEEVLRRAQAIMPETKRSVARLVRTTLDLAGARRGGDDSFQLVYEAQDLRARLLFERTTHGWTVTGRVEGDATEAVVGDTAVALDEQGRFIAELDRSGGEEILVRRDGGDVALPLPPEVTSGGPDRAP